MSTGNPAQGLTLPATALATHISIVEDPDWMPKEILTKEEIANIFLDNGFSIKEGYTDLKPYVYRAARELEKAIAAKLLSTNSL